MSKRAAGIRSAKAVQQRTSKGAHNQALAILNQEQEQAYEANLPILLAEHQDLSLLEIRKLTKRAEWCSNYNGKVPVLPTDAYAHAFGPQSHCDYCHGWLVCICDSENKVLVTYSFPTQQEAEQFEPEADDLAGQIVFVNPKGIVYQTKGQT